MRPRGEGAGEGVCGELGMFCYFLFLLVDFFGGADSGGGGIQVTYFKQRRVMEASKKETLERLEREGARPVGEGVEGRTGG